jgi:hypothetical protein
LMTLATVIVFPGSGDAQQGLKAIAAREPGRELRDRLGLIAGGLEGRLEVEFGAGHSN